MRIWYYIMGKIESLIEKQNSTQQRWVPIHTRRRRVGIFCRGVFG